MSIEAMKQAKQVIAMLGAPNPLNFSKDEIIAWQKCNADLDQAIAEAEKQEPVAYLNPDDLCADTAFRWCKIDEFTQPVYTHPQPKAEQALAQPKAEQCTWTQSEDPHMPDTWESDCGAVWTFMEGSPKENQMDFCCKCGKPTHEANHGITQQGEQA